MFNLKKYMQITYMVNPDEFNCDTQEFLTGIETNKRLSDADKVKTVDIILQEKLNLHKLNFWSLIKAYFEVSAASKKEKKESTNAQ